RCSAHAIRSIARHRRQFAIVAGRRGDTAPRLCSAALRPLCWPFRSSAPHGTHRLSSNGGEADDLAVALRRGEGEVLGLLLSRPAPGAAPWPPSPPWPGAWDRRQAPPRNAPHRPP